MALFSRKQKTEEQKTEAASVASTQNSGSGSVAHVLKNPRITEKASLQQGFSVYTFDVAESATKAQITSAIRSVYKVSPRKIRVVKVPSKATRSMRTGRTGVKTGGKKAYVYLKSSETITIS